MSGQASVSASLPVSVGGEGVGAALTTNTPSSSAPSSASLVPAHDISTLGDGLHSASYNDLMSQQFVPLGVNRPDSMGRLVASGHHNGSPGFSGGDGRQHGGMTVSQYGQHSSIMAARESSQKAEQMRIQQGAQKAAHDQGQSALMHQKESLLRSYCVGGNTLEGSPAGYRVRGMLGEINRQLGLPLAHSGSWKLPT